MRKNVRQKCEQKRKSVKLSDHKV